MITHPTQRIADRRKARIVAIKASVRQLGMDDGTYRALLENVTGLRSAADMDLDQLGSVLDRLRALGATSPTHTRRRPVPAADRAPLVAKINALLMELAAVSGRPVGIKYADAIAKRNGWAENVDFCDARGLRNVVGALNRTLQFKRAGS